MDLTESIAPRSDQVNADDLVGGPITYTVREVIAGKAEQPFDFMLVETDRAYRPSKTMRRLIVAAWGPDTKVYAGRRLTLYREPTIRFGGAVVGGIRISHMSNLPDGKKRIEEKFQTTRGKRETFAVDLLPDAPDAPAAPAAPAEPTPAELADQVASALTDATTEAEVREWGNRAATRNLLDLTPAGATGTLREMVQARLEALAADGGDN